MTLIQAAARMAGHPAGRGTEHRRSRRENQVTVARVTELSATSTVSFEDAIRQGVARATRTLRNVTSAWVKEQRVEIRDAEIREYQVNLLVTFVLDD
jgi:flavin-binding protein dodecin